MSPNVCACILIATVAVIVLGAISCFSEAKESGELICALLGILLVVVAFLTFAAAGTLYEFAIRRTWYEQRNRPDGTRVWTVVRASEAK